MESEARGTAEWEFQRGVAAIARGEDVAALAHLEKAMRLYDNPAWFSYLGYCVARERGQIRRGIDHCQVAMAHDPTDLVHYLNLGKIHLVAGNKGEALRLFREGLAIGENDELRRRLTDIGNRKPPIFKSLSRNHPMNRYLGLILHRLGLR